jgi:hypothetical protein
MEQLVILIIIGLISLINWIIQKSAEAKEKAQAKRKADQGGASFQPDASLQREEEQTTDPGEGMRKLMEALGVPMEEEVRRPAPRASQPPPLPEETFIQSHRPVIVEEEQPRPVRRPVVMPQASSVRRVRERKKADLVEVSRANPAQEALKKALGSKDSLKTAVILSEVLGKPRGLRRFDPFAG